MRTTRPVFESFDAFVSFINEAEDESMTFDTFLSSNSSFFDEDAKLAFDAMKIAATRAPLSIDKDGEALKKNVGTYLGKMNDTIKQLIEDNKETSEKAYMLRLTGKTTTEVKKFVYPALVNGKVVLTAPVAPFTRTLKPLVASFQKGARADLNDLLTSVNLQNINAFCNAGGYFTSLPSIKNEKKGNWLPWKGKDLLFNTGATDQLLITSIASGINIASNENAIPGDQSTIIPALAFKMKDADKGDSEKAHTTLLLYGVGNIVQGAGDTVPATLVKKDFTTTTVPGTATPYQVPIDGGDAMFEQGSATINTENKIEIDKMLTAALAPLAGKPKSIVITGGASYEPDGQGPINKKLVVDRANAVMTYLETLYPELKGLITVNDKDFSKIQAKDEPKEYEKFRKVYLDITGVLQGASYEEKKDIEYLINGVIKADTVEIIQYAITLEFYKEKGDN